MSYYRYTNSNYHRPSLFGGFRFFPPVIKSLLISNVAIYLLFSLFSMLRIEGRGVTEAVNSLLFLYPIGGGFQVWQLVTYMFMHGGLLHLVFNMLWLWMFGMELENIWGAKKFLGYYLICGIGAGVANLLVNAWLDQGAPTVGASGAIMGVLIAFGMLFPDRPIFVYFLLPIRAKYFVALIIAIDLFSGISATSDGIAHFAHLGGAAVGYAFLLIDQKRYPFQQFFQRRRGQARVSNLFTSRPHDEAGHVSDAKYYDLHDSHDAEVRLNQQRVDEILDKISQNGYQSLTAEEKRILFEASKKLN